nr:hypothetical protein [Mesorhizobium sp.]
MQQFCKGSCASKSSLDPETRRIRRRGRQQVANKFPRHEFTGIFRIRDVHGERSATADHAGAEILRKFRILPQDQSVDREALRQRCVS